MPEVGFEPTKHFAAHLECAPFDHSGTPAQPPAEFIEHHSSSSKNPRDLFFDET